MLLVGSNLTKNTISKHSLAKGLLVSAAAVTAVTAVTANASSMTESLVDAYANSIKQAANSQNVAGVADLVADNAIISLSRNGKTSNLGKKQYLQLLQGVWGNSRNYKYDINISNVVISGNQARIQVKTTETFVQNGQPVTLISNSRATLTVSSNDAVLLRAVTQVAIN